ncbi:MAG: tRNA pseudouridine(13) synthase TruD [Kofleriaceae bacterium]|nr:tRNA pseudouridine(13) synthase TruD [Kofleriaceae bacterium]
MAGACVEDRVRQRGRLDAALGSAAVTGRRDPRLAAVRPAARDQESEAQDPRTHGSDATPLWAVNLPYLTAALPGIGGVLRTSVDDFVVDEEPAYLPIGTGDHVFVRIEKRGLTTPMTIDRIARALSVRARDIGVAGMKDRHAVTRQWLSLPPPVTPEAAQALALEDIRILEVARHPHKLRTGHVRANRFVLRVRGMTASVDEAVERARAILGALATAPGAPNWYGEQRFGREGDNAEKGLAIVRGQMRPPRDHKLARLLVSALQSELFNRWLVARLADGLYAKVLAGDVMHKLRDPAAAQGSAAAEGVVRSGGGMFVSDAPDVDEARLLAGEVGITGPMFGERMRRPTDGSPAAAREAAILDAAGLSIESFQAVRSIAEGTRRDATVEVGSPSVRADGDAVEVAFSLPGGAYATTIMREIMKADVPREPETAEHTNAVET